MFNWLKVTFSGWKLAALIFFVGLLALGLIIYRDYGLGWDEQQQYILGISNYHYVLGINQDLLTFSDRYYGPVFELFLTILTISLPRDAMIYTRHLWIFLSFAVGVFIFFLLIRKIWHKDWLALAGSLALVISPRIFADAFYNSKDIPCMVGFIFAFYTLIRYLDHPTWKNLLLHAFASALLIAIRITGLLVPGLTIVMAVLILLFNRHPSSRQVAVFLAQLAVYIIFGFGLVVLFMPILWHDPFGGIVTSFQTMSKYPALATMVFKGFEINSDGLPLNYIPTWIAITTPFLYLAAFLIGLVNSVVNLFLAPGLLVKRDKRNLLLLLAWFFIPLLIVILLKSTLYDGWRQMYFVYPALILIGLQGLLGILKIIGRLPRPAIGKLVVAGLLLLGIAAPFSFMVRNHPYQNVYFNRLAGENLAQAKNLYEMDYWGLSAKKALDYILSTDPAPTIVINGDGDPPKLNSYLLPPDQAKRLQFTDEIGEANYFIGNYRNHPQDYPYPNEVFNVTVDGAKLVSVFRLR